MSHFQVNIVLCQFQIISLLRIFPQMYFSCAYILRRHSGYLNYESRSVEGIIIIFNGIWRKLEKSIFNNFIHF